MKKETFSAAIKSIEESAKSDTMVKFDIYFKSGSQTTRLVNVGLDKINVDLYRSTDNIGKEWYFSVDDVLMVSKFNN